MKYVLLAIFSGLLMSCHGPEPRKPVKVNSGSSFKASIARSRAILGKEEKMIQRIITADRLHEYAQTSNGSWFYYNVKDEKSDATIEATDIVTLTYNVVSFSNDTIYKMTDIGVQKFRADQLNLFPGLRNSVPLLKENETATFLFPSSLGYGYHGDDNKIGINIPLKSTVTILKIEKPQNNTPDQID